MSFRKYLAFFCFLFFILSVFLAISAPSNAEVSRYITFDMNDVNDFELIKSRTYSGNETGMLRTQVDRQFGNDNGYLDQGEVDLFVASYNDYLDQSDWIIMGEAYIIKQNATVVIANLEGSTSDTSESITTTFTFSAKSPATPHGREHYFKFSRELWKYVDLDGAGVYTQENNLTFVAPEKWQITYTQGLLNITLMDNGRILTANANLQFEWIQVKISGELGEEPEDNGEDGPSQSNILLIGILILSVTVIIVSGLVMGRRRARIDPDERGITGDNQILYHEKIKELEDEKVKIKAEIIQVRTDLRTERISKDQAKTRERALKEKYKNIEMMLKSAR